jgi:Ca2+-binding RTX toxin-like protein
MPVQFKFGTERSDWLYGADGDDWYLNGYGGDDHLYGAGGDDILWGGKGADYLDGGREQEDGDTADYSSSDAAVIVNLHSNVGHGYGGEAEGDTLIDIENLVGSQYDDWLWGSDEANDIYGNAGNDSLKGYGGADKLDGGDGVDTASYDGSPSGVTVSLWTGFANGGDATGDTFESIENLTGSNHDDQLQGDNGSNILHGQNGIDTLSGADGADFLYGDWGDDYLYGWNDDDQLFGGPGNDVLSGGAGNDILTGGDPLGGAQDMFMFTAALDAATNVDTITDFNSPDDIFWLGSAIFTTLTPSNVISANQFCIGDVALDGDDRIIYDQTYGEIMYDPDGTGAAAAIQFAQVMPGQAIAYDDFLVSY